MHRGESWAHDREGRVRLDDAGEGLVPPDLLLDLTPEGEETNELGGVRSRGTIDEP
jgi:hypothetical protein